MHDKCLRRGGRPDRQHNPWALTERDGALRSVANPRPGPFSAIIRPAGGGRPRDVSWRSAQPGLGVIEGRRPLFPRPDVQAVACLLHQGRRRDSDHRAARVGEAVAARRTARQSAQATPPGPDDEEIVGVVGVRPGRGPPGRGPRAPRWSGLRAGRPVPCRRPPRAVPGPPPATSCGGRDWAGAVRRDRHPAGPRRSPVEAGRPGPGPRSPHSAAPAGFRGNHARQRRPAAPRTRQIAS